MSRGKKYGDEVREKAFALLSSGNGAQYTSDAIGIPYSTVKTWERAWLTESDDAIASSQSLAELRNKKKEEFINRSWKLVDKATVILERRLDRAVRCEGELDELMENMKKCNGLQSEELRTAYAKLASLRLDSIKELSVVLGTLYDKQALAAREATAVIDGGVTLRKFEDF